MIDGEHLHAVREIVLDSSAATAVTAIAESRHLPHLDTLTLNPDRSNSAWPAEQYRAYANSSLADRVKHLKVVIGRIDEAAALRDAFFANLIGLNIGVATNDWHESGIAASTALNAAWTACPTLRELTLSGDACNAVGVFGGWRDNYLRRFVVNGLLASDPLCNLIRRDECFALTDLSISTRCDIGPCYAVLAESPLTGWLRHLRLIGGGVMRPLIIKLIRALDPEKLESLVLDRGVRDMSEVWDELQERFPGRVSLV